VTTSAPIVSQSGTHIVIVNYNAGPWLTRSVRSALANSLGPVTVVDNASTDQSVADAQSKLSDPRLTWLINADNRGFAVANNQVLKVLDSDFAVLMNPDCELPEHTLDEILKVFSEHPGMGMASCKILNEDGSLQPTSRRRFPTPWLALVRMLQLHRMFPSNPRFANFDYGDLESSGLERSDLDGGDLDGGDLDRHAAIPAMGVEFVDAVSGAFMVVRKAALDDVGMLDEAYFMHCEDLDWCKRFANAGWSVGFVPNVSVIHAKGVSTQSRPVGVLWTLHKGMNRFFDKFYFDQYSAVIRYGVKLGIAVSFIGRAGVSLLRGLLK